MDFPHVFACFVFSKVLLSSDEKFDLVFVSIKLKRAIAFNSNKFWVKFDKVQGTTRVVKIRIDAPYPDLGNSYSVVHYGDL